LIHPVRRLPSEFWFAAVVLWATELLATLGMVVPYWLGGHTWGIRYGRFWFMAAVVLSIPAWVVYHRRFGSEEQIKQRLVVSGRYGFLCTVIVVLGLVPGVAVIVAVAARAGLA
jgi:hypothetical protein